jgi:enolase
MRAKGMKSHHKASGRMQIKAAFMADFAIAMGGGQIKSGSACRSERIAKHNRLLEIEAELGSTAVFESPIRQ